MILTEPYKFPDGRNGFFTRSTLVYKITEDSIVEEVDGELVERRAPKTIYYDIRKKGTDEIYKDAKDIIRYEYEEVTHEEMEAKYGSNK